MKLSGDQQLSLIKKNQDKMISLLVTNLAFF
jgi:hypothetical protein